VTKADVAELVDARDLKSLDGNIVWVRFPPPAPEDQTTPAEMDMADNDDDLSDQNENDEVSEFDELTDLLFERVSEFADDEDVPDEVLPMLLLRLSLTTRMMAYATSVAQPSAGGLKLDLDRFRQEADELIRAMKKDAETFIAHAKEALAAEAAEPEDDEG
jgi:hypothetical protein